MTFADWTPAMRSEPGTAPSSAGMSSSEVWFDITMLRRASKSVMQESALFPAYVASHVCSDALFARFVADAAALKGRVDVVRAACASADNAIRGIADRVSCAVSPSIVVPKAARGRLTGGLSEVDPVRGVKLPVPTRRSRRPSRQRARRRGARATRDDVASERRADRKIRGEEDVAHDLRRSSFGATHASRTVCTSALPPGAHPHDPR